MEKEEIEIIVKSNVKKWYYDIFEREGDNGNIDYYIIFKTPKWFQFFVKRRVKRTVKYVEEINPPNLLNLYFVYGYKFKYSKKGISMIFTPIG